MWALFITLMVLFLFVCLVMTLLVLIQKGRGGGLASAFGGAGGNTAFGSKTGDVLTWATSIVFGVFLLLAIFLNLVANRVNARIMGAPAIAAPAAQPASNSPSGSTPAGNAPVEQPAAVIPSTAAPTTAPASTPSTQPSK